MKDVMLWAGAGQIGMAIARRMGAGMKIVVGDKKLANAQAIAKTMNEAGFDVTPVEMDLSSRSSIKALIAGGAEVRRDQDARQRCGCVAQSGAHRGDPEGRPLRYGGTFRRGRQGHRTGRRGRDDLEPVLLAHARPDGGAGRKARHHADGGAAVPRLFAAREHP